MGLRSEEAVVSGYPFHLDLVDFLPLPAKSFVASLDPGIFTVLLQLPRLQAGGDETRHQCMISTYREHNHLEGLISCLYRLVKQYRLAIIGWTKQRINDVHVDRFSQNPPQTYWGAKALATVLRRRSSNSSFPFSDMSTLAQPLFTHASDRPCVPRFVRIWQAEPCLVCSL